jgi:hypothetical protein
MLFVECCELGLRRCHELLGLERGGELHVINPDNLDHYKELTGYGAWRTYKLRGDSVVVEPIPILIGRTLVGHSAVHLMTRWTLRGTVGDVLPPWFESGLANYIADMGAHLVNFMAQFRYVKGDILIHPEKVDSILTAPPAEDVDVDREVFRTGRYGAFLMVWRLIEEHGGLPKLREFLAGLQDGESTDAMAKRVYGMDMASLAEWLDPVDRGDPLGLTAKQDPFGSRPAHRTPGQALEMERQREEKKKRQQEQKQHEHGQNEGDEEQGHERD